jgi:hypothetical protein
MGRDYGYMRSDVHRAGQVHIRKGQTVAGHAIGILVLNVWYPLLPGNVANASTFPFPVRYKTLFGGVQERVHRGDPELLAEIVQAGQELVQDGVRAIVGACGYLSNYQREVAAALDVPVFLSSLLQVPLIHRSLKPQQKVGILCANAPGLTPATLAASGVTPEIPVAILGLEYRSEFRAILDDRGEFDVDRLEREVVGAAQRLVSENPDVGAIVLECSDMPPFACAVQAAVGLPVFDFATMIRWVYHAVVQRPYEGFI